VDRLTNESSNIKGLAIQLEARLGSDRAYKRLTRHGILELNRGGIRLQSNDTPHQTISEFQRAAVRAHNGFGTEWFRIDQPIFRQS
jgi:hypothetical protein